nr:MAG TPA: hypothetical protein [Caudoviricetes sp.]
MYLSSRHAFQIFVPFSNPFVSKKCDHYCRHGRRCQDLNLNYRKYCCFNSKLIYFKRYYSI